MQHYFIDGYNLLFRTDSKYRTLELKRRALLEYLDRMAVKNHLDITVVFDGNQKDPLESVRGHFKSLEIIYTAENESADQYITEAVQHNPSKHIVVTSDLELAKDCKLRGSKTMTIESFLSTFVKKKKREKIEKEFQETEANIARLLKIFEEGL